MNDLDIEQALSRLKLKTPSDHVRSRVLGAAHEAWERRSDVMTPFPRSGLRWIIGYASAAALLILLNVIWSTWDSIQMAEIMTPTVSEQPIDPDLQECYAELGRNPEVFRRLSLMSRPIGNAGSPVESWKQRQEMMKSLGLEV